MSNLQLNIPHQLSQEEALGRIRKLLTNLQQEHKDSVSNVQENWDGNKGDFSFSAKGFDIAGNIEVTGSEVNIQSDLPFAVSFFKGMIASLITDKAKALLA